MQTCTNTVGSYTCDCASGYAANEDGVCVDLDECADANDCTELNPCQNMQGNFYISRGSLCQ